MTNDQTGRTPRQTTGGSPAASMVMIVVTVVAVVAGFFILKQIRDDDTSSPTRTTDAPTGGSTDVSGSSTTTSAPIVTASTAPPFTTTGTNVVVANASQANGVAKALSTELAGKGFTMGDATNATGEKRATSVIYYVTTNPSALAVANSVASLMGVTAVEAIPAAIPTSSAALPEGVGVLVMLGNDKAGKTLAAMGGGATTTDSSTTTVAGAGAVPSSAA